MFFVSCHRQFNPTAVSVSDCLSSPLWLLSASWSTARIESLQKLPLCFAPIAVKIGLSVHRHSAWWPGDTGKTERRSVASYCLLLVIACCCC